MTNISRMKALTQSAKNYPKWDMLKKGKKGLTKRERFDIISKLSREGEQKGEAI